MNPLQQLRGGATCEPPRWGVLSRLSRLSRPEDIRDAGWMWEAWPNLGERRCDQRLNASPVANGGLYKHGADNKRGPVAAEGDGGGQRGQEEGRVDSRV